jgi:hypothetical protein
VIRRETGWSVSSAGCQRAARPGQKAAGVIVFLASKPWPIKWPAPSTINGGSNAAA